MPTHYEVLGVAPDADTEAIRRAYVVVAKANHPDRRQRDDPPRRARAEERMRAANAAWHVLRDPQRRAEYDQSLRSPGKGHATTASPPSPAPTGASRVGSRPAPPSGVVVPAGHATLWRYAPIVVVLAVLVGLLVFSAYATSKDAATSPGTQARVATPEVGDCVLVAALSGGQAPVPVSCGTQGAYQVRSTVATPRPCPTGTDVALALSDHETTLCLAYLG